MTSTTPPMAGGVPVARLLRPRSIAILGASAEPATIGARAVAALERFAFDGDLHLINPKRDEINGRPCLSRVDDLPLGVDVVMMAIPQAGTLEAVRACARRQVGAAVVFTSGFSETGAQGIREQQEMTDIARANGIALLGPNCYGLVNYADGIPLTSGPVRPRPPGAGEPALAIISQSGGMMGCLLEAAEAKGIALTSAISTGNEAVVTVEDFLAEIVEDARTAVIAVFAEQLRHPQRFLALAARARVLGKTIVLLHSGRSARAQEAAKSHTGAMASDFAAMETLVGHQAVVLVDDIEQVIDTAEFLLDFPQRPTGGLGIITDSGAFKGLALDFCESHGVDVPVLRPATVEALRGAMPAFADLSNPLDLTAQVMRDMEGMYGGAICALAGDPDIGCILVTLLMGAPQVVQAKLTATAAAARTVDVPVAVLMLGGDSPLPAEAYEIVRRARLPFFRSATRAIGAMAHLFRHGRRLRRNTGAPAPVPATPNTPPRFGLLAEYEGKAWLADAGIPIPKGRLARTPREAGEIAAAIGYPVVLKAQAAELTHKSDVGGVIVDVRDPGDLQAAWARMTRSVSAARPDLTLDGILVEKMGARGVELVLGARRDPQWGPLVMLGLGGVWIEVLKDVVFLPALCSAEEVRTELQRLKGAALLNGARGAPPADIEAVSHAVVRLGRLLAETPSLEEIDINPLVAYPPGQGILALDAVVVSSPPPSSKDGPDSAGPGALL
ncbi:acetate--CoA ligase family protein [Xanthobacter agilis]|uniref:acetate--CoA ligase family protein n=1 Tax=Xanthobacter agilis TaxID=47492 RepID=UPI00372BA085